MRYSRIVLCCIIVSITIASLVGLAKAQWGSAVLDSISVGPENDQLGDGVLALDNFGDLHVLYDRTVSGNHDFYYVTKPNGGDWSDPVQVVDPGLNPTKPYLAVNEATGEPYVVYLESGGLKLAYCSGGSWSYYDLPTPGVGMVIDPALAVDADGNAHVAVIGMPGGIYKMCYGYWDGPSSNQFYFQVIEDSQLGDYGSGAHPNICVRSDGSVAICYRGGNYMMYRVDVAENASLGGTAWEIATMSNPGMHCYPGKIRATANDDLYIAYHGNYGFGFPNDGFFSFKTAGAAAWETPVEVTGPYSAGDAKLAVEDDGTAHILFQETSGNFFTGNILYATNQSGTWTVEYLQTGDKYYPSIVVDAWGNGSMVFEQYAGTQNYDIYYYGYVAPVLPPNLDVTITPENPPIVIPREGGTFSYRIDLTNNGSMPVVTDVWTDVILPSGAQMMVMVMPDIGLTAGATRTRDFVQNVPDRAPGGAYTYRSFVGSYESMTVVDADSFEFSKLGDGDGMFSLNDWLLTETTAVNLPETTKLLGVSPNPFNPVTNLHYEVAERVHLKIAVFDAMGRKVATLVDRVEDIGTYSVSWSGKNHPAGVYFARMTIDGGAGQVKKLILVK